MKKEQNILEVVNRVIKFNEDEEKKRSFLQTPIIKIIMYTFQNMNDILQELLKSKKITNNKIKKILGSHNRLIYLGIFLVIIAVFLAMIEIADGW